MQPAPVASRSRYPAQRRAAPLPDTASPQERSVATFQACYKPYAIVLPSPFSLLLLNRLDPPLVDAPSRSALEAVSIHYASLVISEPIAKHFGIGLVGPVSSGNSEQRGVEGGMRRLGVSPFVSARRAFAQNKNVCRFQARIRAGPNSGSPCFQHVANFAQHRVFSPSRFH